MRAPTPAPALYKPATVHTSMSSIPFSYSNVNKSMRPSLLVSPLELRSGLQGRRSSNTNSATFLEMSPLEVESSSANRRPDQESGPASRLSESGNSKEPLPERSQNSANDARSDFDTISRAPEESKNSSAAGEDSARKDDEKDPLQPEVIRLGKKISRAVNILEQEIEEALDEHRMDIPESLDKQIENLRKLGKALNKQEKSE